MHSIFDVQLKIDEESIGLLTKEGDSISFPRFFSPEETYLNIAEQMEACCTAEGEYYIWNRKEVPTGVPVYLPTGVINPIPMSKQVLTNPVPTPLNPISFFSGKIKSSFGRLFKKRKDKTNKIPTSAADSMGGRISQKGKDNKIIRSDAAAFIPKKEQKVDKRKGGVLIDEETGLYKKNPQQSPYSQKHNKTNGFDPDTATTKQKGNYGEIITDEHMKTDPNIKNKGIDLERIGDPPPSGINDKIRKGIDGIYENKNYPPPPKYVITESKYGSSELGNTQNGRQMSDTWVEDRVEKMFGRNDPKGQDIINSLQNGEVDKVLSRVDSNGNVTNYRLYSNGFITGPWP